MLPEAKYVILGVIYLEKKDLEKTYFRRQIIKQYPD